MVKASLGMIELFLLKDELIIPKEKVTFDNTL